MTVSIPKHLCRWSAAAAAAVGPGSVGAVVDAAVLVGGLQDAALHDDVLFGTHSGPVLPSAKEENH